MIDIESHVFDPIAKAIREKFPNAFVTGEYVRTPSRFPHVSIVEADNYMTRQHLDSSGQERYATLMYEVNVYSNKASGKKSECREIASVIDEEMYKLNMIRTSLSPVPNLEDATIYRVVARYEVEADGEYMYRV